MAGDMPTVENTEWEEMFSEQYLPIIKKYLPEFLTMFSERSQDYGEAFLTLGGKGQFSDINRKFWKLKKAVWDEEELVGEQVPEILNDIIAHCFLLRLCLDREDS